MSPGALLTANSSSPTTPVRLLQVREIISVLDPPRQFSIPPQPDNAPSLQRVSFDARGNIVIPPGSGASNPITSTTHHSSSKNANMAPPNKTEAEKKAHKANKARERRERRKAEAKSTADAAAANAQDPAHAPFTPASTPAPGQENEAAPQPGKQYDVSHTGAKIVTIANSRKRSATDPPVPAHAEDSDNDDIDLASFNQLTPLISQVTILKTERLGRDAVDKKAEKKYNIAKRLYQADALSKKAIDDKAKEWETSLEAGIAAHEARRVQLVNLENEIDKEFRRIATRMLVANDFEATAGSILEDFQDLSMYNRKGLTRVGNDHQQKNTQREAKEKRESRIEALADFWTLGLGRDKRDFDQLVRSLTHMTKDNKSNKSKKK